MLTFDFSKRDYRTAYNEDDLKLIKRSYDGYGQMSIEILQFLWGREWGPMALSFVLAENPECLRVSSGALSLDCRPGRITVMVDKDGKIERIEKEIIINLPEGFTCGADVEEWITDPDNYIPKEWPTERNRMSPGFVYCPNIPDVMREYTSPDALRELRGLLKRDMKK